MIRSFGLFVCLIVVVGLLSGCDAIPGLEAPTAVSRAAAMLPELDGYLAIEGQTLTDYLGKLSGGSALLLAQPELAALVAAVDGVVGCYQDVGAARARVYSNRAQPLMAGTVAVADRDALLDPINLFRCVGLQVWPQAQALNVKPCTATYTLPKEGNEFYILYAGTTTEICQAFCTHLEGCTAHRP